MQKYKTLSAKVFKIYHVKESVQLNKRVDGLIKKKKSKTNNFKKGMLTEFMESDCKRQLFLKLAQNYGEKWIKPPRKPLIEQRWIKKSELLIDIGKKYERKVYSQLIKIPGVKYNPVPIKIAGEMTLSKKELEEIYQELIENPNKFVILLEHQFKNPISFFEDLFPPKEVGDKIPVDISDQRPDILIINSKSMQKSTNELIYTGEVIPILKNDAKKRFGINIIDIKATHGENVGKKQFVEIFYYMRTLAYFLHDLKLDDKFFINIDGNGILPSLNDQDLGHISNASHILDNFVSIRWNESSRIFSKVYNNIKELWHGAPCSIESIPLNMHIKCGYCFFLRDCKETLGYGDSNHPENWSLKLIPYTSMSISEQLLDMGFKTIGDLLQNIENIAIGSYPKPLYPELPLLKLKARALVENRLVQPSLGHANSYSLPRYSPISITYAVESDNFNEKVFSLAVNLSMMVGQKSSYCLIFDSWWKIWKEALNNDDKPEQIQIDLNNILFLEIPLEYVISFKNSMKSLQNFKIILKGEPYRKLNEKEIFQRKQTTVHYKFITINKDLTDESEFEMVKLALKVFSDLIILCNIIESYVVVEGFNQDTLYGPDTAIFYWSSQQSDNIGDLLERNLKKIIEDPQVGSKFTRLVTLFTPSDSEVTHPYKHKKIYDVQKFVESMVGFPAIINYTWHEMGKEMLGSRISPRFWIPHYNYMDFNQWHEYVEEKVPEKKEKKRIKISQQMAVKIFTISNLKQKFQNQLRNTISRHSRPVSSDQYRDALLGTQFHPLSHVWYLFSKLTTAKDEQECELYRTMYPEYSIGKLAAARVSNLQKIPTKKKYKYMLNISDLSSNMKIKKGDRVLLIPAPLRDIKTSKRLRIWQVEIDTMFWESSKNGYRIITKETSTNLFDQFRDDMNFLHRSDEFDPKCEWYFYPTSFDAWSIKLFDARIGRAGLLQRKDFGTSWLGYRLSFLWEINSRSKLAWPDRWDFNIHAILLFAPGVFKKILLPETIDSDKLITPISPTPDLSQKLAISHSLNNIIYGIQGPPGTGKSQTVAALIDEYICRCKAQKKSNIRILITAFSYSAMKVIIEKIRKGINIDGTPTASSRVQLIFVRPDYREPIPHVEGYPDIVDLSRSGDTWKLNGQGRTVTRSKLLEQSLEDYCIIFANAFQLFHLPTRVDPNFHFDFICVDEASQLPVDQLMASLYFAKNVKLPLVSDKKIGVPGEEITLPSEIDKLVISPDAEINPENLTKLIIVGDYNQLPPVQTVLPPKNLEKILDSTFGYYVKHHNISSSQLNINYRSHKDIVNFTASMGIYTNISAHSANAEKIIRGQIENVQSEWVKEVLLPKRVVGALIHDHKFEMGVSVFEANLIAEIVTGFYKMQNPDTVEKERIFWNKSIGIVSPHNAQGRLIILKIYDKLTDDQNTLTKLNVEELMILLNSAVVSVEKFQGSDRDFILSSIGISDKDQLKSEAKFIYNLNRFNVLTSRAKSKLLFVCSEEFLDFIPNDRETMEEAAQSREFALKYCDKEIILSLILDNKENERVRFRFK